MSVFPHKIKILRHDGKVIENVESNVQGKKIFMSDISTPIEEYDLIEYLNSAGLIETYFATDVQYYEHPRLGHIEVDVEKIPKNVENNINKIRNKLKNKDFWVQVNIEGKDCHLLLGKRDGSNRKVHLIIDSETGETRIDRDDQAPHDLLASVESIVTLKNGGKIKATKTSLDFLEDEGSKNKADKILVYSAMKRDVFLLEVYNASSEDVDSLEMKISWEQPEGSKERELKDFISYDDNPVMAVPSSLNILKSKERKYAYNIPNISSDKKIKIELKCRGIETGREYFTSCTLETPNQYRYGIETYKKINKSYK